MYKAALDVYYYNNDTARAVCFMFKDWKDTKPALVCSKLISGIGAYESGAYYKREIPCLLSILEEVELQSLEVIIIDGYVFLDDKNTFGLGGYLYKALNEAVPVIGVAKTPYHNNTKNAVELTRGKSVRPLYITAIGIDVTVAASCIKNMAGNYRIPDLLKMLDKSTREN